MNKEPRNWGTVRRLKSPCQISLRLSEEENTRLENAAQERGVSKAGYVKSVVLGRPISQASRRPKAVEADLRQLLGLMGKLGSNANQIARLGNSGTSFEQRELLETLRGIQGELMTLRALLIQALKGEP